MSTHNNSSVITAAGNELSVQVVQDIYNTLTGKTEILSRIIYRPYVVKSGDIDLLCARIDQIVEQYNTSGISCSFTVSYSDGKVERFSGAERFKTQASSHGRAIETVDITYDFLVVLPKTREPKAYSVVIGVRSTVGVLERLHSRQASDFEWRMFSDLDTATGRISIEYVDYAVAKTLESHLVDWFESLPVSRGERSYKILSILVRPLGVICRVLPLALFGYFFAYRDFLKVGDLGSLFKGGVIFGAGIMIVNVISMYFVAWARERKVIFRPNSFICLGPSDERALNTLKQTKVVGFFKSAGGYAVAITSGVVGAYIAKKLGI